MRRLLLVGMLALGLCLAQAPKKNPFAGDAKAADIGRVMFRGSCSTCHGIHAEGGRGPDLSLGTYSVGDNDEDLFGVISNGSPGTEMPDFGARLEDEDIWRLVTYLRSVTRREAVPLKGNADSGRKLFWEKGQCAQCHRIEGRGGRMGPDLTTIGRQRSLAYLRESVVSPNADLTSGYATITVVTKDGRKITGVQRGFDNFSAQLMDVSESFYSFLRSDVSSVKREYKSMMPDIYGKMLSASEMDDLVAYLAGLRGSREGKR